MRMSTVMLAAIAAMSQSNNFFDRPYTGKGYSGAPIEPEPPKDKTAELKKRRDKRARRAKRGY